MPNLQIQTPNELQIEIEVDICTLFDYVHE